MGKNVLILSTSPRKNDYSEALADAFMQGAEETGNTVEKAACTTKASIFAMAAFPAKKQGIA